MDVQSRSSLHFVEGIGGILISNGDGHAIAGGQVPVDDPSGGQVFHAFGNLAHEVEEVANGQMLKINWVIPH